MSSDYLYTTHDDHLRQQRSELITQAEIQHRLVKIQDQLYMMDVALKAIATALANLRQETTPLDPTRWEGQAQ